MVAETLTESRLGVWLPGEDLYLGQEEEEKELVPTKHTHYGHFQRWGLVEKPLADYSIVSSVRNPFDFWVSEYTRHRTRWSVSLDNPESHIYKNHGDDMVRKSLELEFAEWLEYRWEKFSPKHTQLPHPEFTGNADHLLRFEQLEDSFQSWLRGLGLAAPPWLATQEYDQARERLPGILRSQLTETYRANFQALSQALRLQFLGRFKNPTPTIPGHLREYPALSSL